jgi:hypothetical protein
MRNHCDGAAVAIQKMIHFRENAALEDLKAFPRRRGKVGISTRPFLRIHRILPLNLFPAHAFPISEINLSQRRAQHPGNISTRHNRLRGAGRAAQIAAIHRIQYFVGKRLGQPGKLRPTLCVQVRVGVSTIPACHLRFRMTNEKHPAHAFHTPQRYTAISVN